MKKFNCIKQITVWAVLIPIFFSLGIFLSPQANAASDPNILSTASILVEVDTGRVLYANNENTPVPPASLTKIMTVMLAVEACEDGKAALNDVVKVNESAYYDVTADGSTLDIAVGEEITFKDLLYAALVVSANEACNIIAEYISGDISTFIGLMNQRAQELGCTNTHFANTHGLPNDDHYTTAHDLYRIADAAMKLPLFSQIAGTVEYSIPANNLAEPRSLTTTNNLLIPDSRYYYDLATGVKTGYTAAAGYCLVSSAKSDDMSLISVVLGAESLVIEDGSTQVRSFSESKRLLQWGFDNFSYQTILSPLDLLAEVPVLLGDGADTVVLRPKTPIVALLDNEIDITSLKTEVRIFSEETGEVLSAPISQGDILGSVSVELDGVDYGTIELVANTSISLNRGEYLKQKIKDTFSNTYVRLLIVFLVLLVLSYIAFIIIYNRNRKRKRAIADEIARRKIEELRRGENLTTGKSFEEIENMYKRT